MKGRKKWDFLAVLLIAAGILFLLKEPVQNYLIRNITEQNQITDYTIEEIRQNEEVTGEFDFDQAVNVDWKSVMDSYRNRTNLPVIGGIAIPSIDLHLPILKGISNENIIAGAGTMSADQELGKGNYALASHNLVQEGVLFSDVQYMQLDDLVYITNMERIAVYRVTYLEQVSPSRVELVEEVPGKTLLTLVTCSNDTLMRWVCQAELVQTVELADATKEMAAALQLKE